MSRILTTHVGSLPRSQEVVDFIFSRENNHEYDKAEFDVCMKKNVSDTAEKQKNAGIDIVSDGETSKISYATYVKDRYSGFSGDSPRNPPEAAHASKYEKSEQASDDEEACQGSTQSRRAFPLVKECHGRPSNGRNGSHQSRERTRDGRVPRSRGNVKAGGTEEGREQDQPAEREIKELGGGDG